MCCSVVSLHEKKKSNNARLKRKQEVTEFALAWKRAQSLGAFATVPCDQPSPACGCGLPSKLFGHIHMTSQKCALAKRYFFSSQEGNNFFHKVDLRLALVLVIGLGND